MAGIETRFDEDLAKLAQAARGWAEEKRDRFAACWRRLEAEGAELVDAHQEPGMVIVIKLSEDFKQHCAAFGVIIG